MCANDQEPEADGMLANTVNRRVAANSWWAVLLVVLVVIPMLPALSYSSMSHPAEYDELLHVMAARGVAETGSPTIADGTYPRAEFFTRIVAFVSRNSEPGQELLISRVPALLAGVALVALVGGWVTRRAGWLAGLTAATVLAISPLTIQSAILIRFYTLHTLLMTLMLIFWFEAVRSGVSVKARLLLFVLSIPLIVLGLHIHALTQITMLAGSLGVVVLLTYDRRAGIMAFFRHSVLLLSTAAIVLVVAVLALWNVLDVAELLRGQAPLWSSQKAGNYAFYLSAIAVHLPLIWPLLPLMLVIAIATEARLALYFLAVLLVALVINSIAAQKATRYFYHAYPAFCILWGIGFSRLLMYAIEESSRLLHLKKPSAMVLTAVIVGLCLINAHEVKRGLKLVINRGAIDGTIPARDEPDWGLAYDKLEDSLQKAEVLAVTSGVKGLYYYGRYDYEVSTTVVQETDTGQEFGTDPRTGMQVIGTADSVSGVIDKGLPTLFVLENRMLDKDYSVPSTTLEVLKSRCDFIDLDDTGSQLSAWFCSSGS